MPSKQDKLPAYRLHKATGRGVVTLSGKDFYLGEFGTQKSRDEYDRRIAEWLANGRRIVGDSISVTELALEYWRFAETYYVKNGAPTDEQAGIKVALRHLKDLYGPTNAADFGPLALKAVRQRMIDAKNARGYINQNVGRIRRMFRWAVENELVTPAIYQALLAVRDLTKGKTAAKETDPVLPVDEATVDATLPHLPEVVAEMIQLQRLAGMRPEEVCEIHPGDIDREGDVWRYVPKSHKMEHKERQRVVFIGPKAQQILAKYLFRDADEPCFVNRIGNGYCTRAYRDAIHAACKRAWPSPEGASPAEKAEWEKQHRWNPNQLRHSAATLIRKEHGLEAAQVILGHSKADTTQIYAERDLQRAEQIMSAVG